MSRPRDETRAQSQRRTDNRISVRIDLVGWTKRDLEALAEQLRLAGNSSSTLAPYRLHSIAKRIDDALE